MPSAKTTAIDLTDDDHPAPGVRPAYAFAGLRALLNDEASHVAILGHILKHHFVNAHGSEKLIFGACAACTRFIIMAPGDTGDCDHCGRTHPAECPACHVTLQGVCDDCDGTFCHEDIEPKCGNFVGRFQGKDLCKTCRAVRVAPKCGGCEKPRPLNSYGICTSCIMDVCQCHVCKGYISIGEHVVCNDCEQAACSSGCSFELETCTPCHTRCRTCGDVPEPDSDWSHCVVCKDRTCPKCRDPGLPDHVVCQGTDAGEGERPCSVYYLRNEGDDRVRYPNDD